MTSNAAASPLCVVELMKLAGDLREAFGALVVAEAAMLEIGRKLDLALASGSDASPLLAELERQGERHAAAEEALRNQAPLIGRVLDGAQKSPSESIEGARAKAGA